MVKRGSNFIPLVLDTRLLVVLNGKASAKNQLNATYIMGLLVEHCREDLNPEVYQELKERYEKTIEQQYAEKQAKEKEQLELERKKLDLKERELKIREQNSEVRTDKQNEIQQEKDREQEINNLERELENIMKPSPIPLPREQVEKNIERANQIRKRLQELKEVKKS